MASDSVLNPEAYFARIGYGGPRTPTPATLAAIHAAHARSIPFENLDVLLGRGIRIDLSSIEQKLVQQKRGGYCFEQNSLLAAVLRELGFGVTPLIARVRWQVPADIVTPLTHMLLRVETAGRTFLADVGFGSMSLTAPLALEFDVEQAAAAFEPRRLVRRDRLVSQEAKIGDEWSEVYRFILEPAPAIDFELGNWFTSTHPQSRFVQNLIAARTDRDHRCTLLNREFSIRRADGRVEKRAIASPDELLTILSEHFGLHFAPGTRFGPPGSPWPS